MSWGKHTYTLLDRINEIEKAMECGFWQSALAMALTIPDICGQIEFTNMVRWDKKHEKYFRLVGEQYKAWYSKYVEHYYADNTGYNEDCTAKRPYFTAEMCYQLRNAFLHSGVDNVDANSEHQIYSFNLRINSCDSISKNESGNITGVTVDIDGLCKKICISGKRFYDNWENQEDFIDKCCEWLDLKEWSEHFHKHN